jgi:hypothetical protein
VRRGARRREPHDESPERRKLAGLTFATVGEKIETTPVAEVHTLARETRVEHGLNVASTIVLIATVVGLWIHFR